MKSQPYKASGKLFRYDFDSSMVEYIAKAELEEMTANFVKYELPYLV